MLTQLLVVRRHKSVEGPSAVATGGQKGGYAGAIGGAVGGMVGAALTAGCGCGE